MKELEKRGGVANNCTSINTDTNTQTNPKSENNQIAKQMIETWNEVFEYVPNKSLLYQSNE